MRFFEDQRAFVHHCVERARDGFLVGDSALRVPIFKRAIPR
jgi:hypothetical protein